MALYLANQELYPTGDDLAMAASYDTEYQDYQEYEAAEARVDPYRRRRKPHRRRRKPKLPPSQDFYAGETVDRDTGYAAPGTGYGTQNAPAPSYSGYTNSLDNIVHNTTEGVDRGGYWQYRGMGEEAVQGGNRRQDFSAYDYYGSDYDNDEDSEEEEGPSMLSMAMQYFTGGLIGRTDDSFDEYSDYYDEDE